MNICSSLHQQMEGVLFASLSSAMQGGLILKQQQQLEFN
jgi:hypothetical protein